MRILWIGPFHSDIALSSKSAVNQAACKWSRGLLSALRVDNEIRVIDHVPEQRWPAGKVMWSAARRGMFLDWFPCERVSYCNVWLVKKWWLEKAYARRARRLFESWRPDVVLCYNSLHRENVAVMREAAKYGIKVVPIILDGDDPRLDNWRKLLADNRFASGIVFLSYWMTQNYPDKSKPILHMDGGADGWHGDSERHAKSDCKPSPVHRLVYTGALDKWRGLGFMKEVVRLCSRPDVRFVFCGKCDRADMLAEFGNDPRVDVKGFLSNEDVDEICRTGDLFLNVRDPGIGNNILNYPSKIPNYLSYGKPVVSTWIDSFSPDYAEVLEICDNTPEGFVREIGKVLEWSREERALKCDRIKAWFMDRKLWDRQARRVIEFVGGLK